MPPLIAYPRPQDPHQFPAQPGDILFQSRDTSEGVAEHTVLIFDVNGDDYNVLALPESLGSALCPWPRKASEWILRARAMNESDGLACVQDLAAASGEFHGQPMRWFFESEFHLYREPSLGMATNCVGFVASALACNGVDTLVSEYTFEFNTPLVPPIRTKPTVGHLARALTGLENLPYAPNQREAEDFATCNHTLAQALNGSLP